MQKDFFVTRIRFTILVNFKCVRVDYAYFAMIHRLYTELHKNQKGLIVQHVLQKRFTGLLKPVTYFRNEFILCRLSLVNYSKLTTFESRLCFQGASYVRFSELRTVCRVSKRIQVHYLIFFASENIVENYFFFKISTSIIQKLFTVHIKRFSKICLW